MNRWLVATGIAVFGISGAVNAGVYQGEVSASYTYSEYDFGSGVGDPESEGARVGFSWYLEPVDPGSGPLGEAAFLGQASAVTLEYGEAKFESNSDNVANESEQDAEAWSVNFRKVFTNAGGWVLELGYGEADQDGELMNGATEVEADVEAYRVSISKYVQPHTEVGVTRSRFEVDRGAASAQDIEIDQMGFWGKTVRACGEGGFFSLWGSATRQYSNESSDALDGSITRVGGSWFPNAGLEVGAELFRNTSDVFEDGDLEADTIGPVGEGYSVFAEYFVVPQASVQLHISQSDFDVPGATEDLEKDTATLRGVFRF